MEYKEALDAAHKGAEVLSERLNDQYFVTLFGSKLVLTNGYDGDPEIVWDPVEISVAGLHTFVNAAIEVAEKVVYTLEWGSDDGSERMTSEFEGLAAAKDGFMAEAQLRTMSSQGGVLTLHKDGPGDECEEIATLTLDPEEAI